MGVGAEFVTDVCCTDVTQKLCHHVGNVAWQCSGCWVKLYNKITFEPLSFPPKQKCHCVTFLTWWCHFNMVSACCIWEWDFPSLASWPGVGRRSKTRGFPHSQLGKGIPILSCYLDIVSLLHHDVLPGLYIWKKDAGSLKREIKEGHREFFGTIAYPHFQEEVLEFHSTTFALKKNHAFS